MNLFPQRCEPIALSHTDTEYRVVADARRGAAMEVWQVERVRETLADGSVRAWEPFYRLSAVGAAAADPGGRYQTARRPSVVGGTETFLGVFDPAFDPLRPADAVLSVDALCLNRDLPASLPFGGGHPVLQLVEGHAAVRRVVCVTAPTPTLRPAHGKEHFWRLVSQLSLSHLSVVGAEAGAAALKEVLRLYDLRELAGDAGGDRRAAGGFGGARCGAGARRARGRVLSRAGCDIGV